MSGRAEPPSLDLWRYGICQLHGGRIAVLAVIRTDEDEGARHNGERGRSDKDAIANCLARKRLVSAS